MNTPENLVPHPDAGGEESTLADSAGGQEPVPEMLTLEQLRKRLEDGQAREQYSLEHILREENVLNDAGWQRYQAIKSTVGLDALGHQLAASNVLSRERYAAAFCKSVGLPYVNLEEIVPEQAALNEIKYATAAAYTVFPICLVKGNLVVAFEDPSDPVAVNAASFSANRSVIPVGAPGRQIISHIEQYYENIEFQQLVRSANIDIIPQGTGETNLVNLERAANQQPVVQLVSSLIHRAIKEGASDINIRPTKEAVMVYFRVDGHMQLVHRLNLEILPALTSRIKIIANMDIAEHRLPQDGHVGVRFMHRDVDLRVSIMPTVSGESTVIRVLAQSDTGVSTADLQFDHADERIFRQLIAHNNGIFLVTGPTGSGKSTTLYAVVEERKHLSRHIITVEDPVEYHIDGVEQIQVNNKIGYTFAEALRHILRHDPDDILVGEMRDQETAEIGIKASLTGHFVMSTLHTNDAITAITRLEDMGIEPYLIASSLVGIMAQRLIRLLCPHCKTEHFPRPSDLAELNLPENATFFRPEGCRNCHNTGYQGRRVVCEIIGITRGLRRMITSGASTEEMRAEVRREGRRSIFGHAISLSAAGLTSLDEAFSTRV